MPNYCLTFQTELQELNNQYRSLNNLVQEGKFAEFNSQALLLQSDIEDLQTKLQQAPVARALDCSLEEISLKPDTITEQTKAYVGPLTPGIFDLIQQYNIEHIYTSFPEGKIERSELTIGGQSAQQLEEQLRAQHINISAYAEDMLHSLDFTEPQQIQLVKLRVDALLAGNPTTDQLFARATELGLELCPAEVGPHQRLIDTDQPTDEWYRIAMKQISDRDGYPRVFGLERSDGELWLYDGWAEPTSEWNPDYQFVFRLRQPSPDS